jgi:thioredoxin-like negative regulator of GroEL
MEQTRIEFLEETLRSDPNSTFARYALAMEFVSAGRSEEALQHLEHLLTHHPDYSAAYYQAGKLLVHSGRNEEARKVLAKGIEITGRQGNHHAQSELEGVLAELTAQGH